MARGRGRGGRGRAARGRGTPVAQPHLAAFMDALAGAGNFLAQLGGGDGESESDVSDVGEEFEPEPHPGNFLAPPAPVSEPPVPVAPPAPAAGPSAASANDSMTSEDGNAPQNCPICFDTFADPKVFPCGHTICALCLDGLVKSAGGGGAKVRLVCVICRAATTVTRNVGLVSNFALAALIEDLKERKDGRLGRREPCSVCNARTPKDQIWFCIDCGDAEKNKADEDEDEEENVALDESDGHEMQGLFPLCPNCLINNHNGHKVSLFNDSVRRRQIRRCFENIETSFASLSGLKLKLEQDWALLAEVVVELATSEYAVDAVLLEKVHADLGRLATQMDDAGWLGKEPRSRLLYHFLRAARSFLATVSAKPADEEEAPSPKRRRSEADENASSERRRLHGFAKLVGEFYAVGMGGTRELVAATFRALLLNVEEVNGARLEATSELAAIVGAKWEKAEVGGDEGGLLPAVLERLRVEAVIKAAVLPPAVKANIQATLQRSKNKWVTHAEPAEAHISLAAQSFFARRLRENVYDD